MTYSTGGGYGDLKLLRIWGGSRHAWNKAHSKSPHSYEIRPVAPNSDSDKLCDKQLVVWRLRVSVCLVNKLDVRLVVVLRFIVCRDGDVIQMAFCC